MASPLQRVALPAAFAVGAVLLVVALLPGTAEASTPPRAPRGPRGPIVPGGRVMSSFGPRGSGFHYGVDISAPSGTPVFAALDGVVAAAYPDGRVSGYGNVVTVSHGAFGTLYAHLDSLAVRTGERVTAGQRIGTVGTTNSAGGFRTSGPHLHLEVIVPAAGVNVERALAHYTGSTPPRIDPVRWAAAQGIAIG